MVYTQEDLENAVDTHFDHGLSVRDAASLYVVPKSTLNDKLKSDQPTKLKRGRTKWLEWLPVRNLAPWMSDKSCVVLSDNYHHSCPKFANILSGISILEIRELVPFISISTKTLHMNHFQLFTSSSLMYLWPLTSYLNLLSRLVCFLSAFKEMKSLNCPTNTPSTLYIAYYQPISKIICLVVTHWGRTQYLAILLWKAASNNAKLFEGEKLKAKCWNTYRLLPTFLYGRLVGWLPLETVP